MAIQKFFPTPIYIGKLMAKGGTRFNRELFKQCHLVSETDPDGHEWSLENYLNGYTSYGSITDLHLRYPDFEELAKKIAPHVRKFSRALDMDLKGGKLIMSSCWVNIMGQSASHTSHLHPISVISGTYYVSVPKDSSGLKFEDPRHSQFMAAPPKTANARLQNQTFVKITPKEGEVALWESWLRHEVPANRSKEKRISISFNFEWH